MIEIEPSELQRKIAEELAKLPPEPKEVPYSFTYPEVRDIIIATVSLIGAFSIALMGGFYIFILWDLDTFLLTLELSAIGVITAFISHELAHKFVAQRYGFKAHFQLWVYGIIMAFVTAFLGFLFAAPGAVYIEGRGATTKQIGRISIAGAITNLSIAGSFLIIFLLTAGFIQSLAFFVMFLNGFLAFFNLLPIAPLDGFGVYQWNKKVLIMLLAIALTIVIFGEIYVYVWI